MYWRRRLGALLVVLAVAGCTEGAVSQGQTRYAPYPPENYPDPHDRSNGM